MYKEVVSYGGFGLYVKVSGDSGSKRSDRGEKTEEKKLISR